MVEQHSWVAALHMRLQIYNNSRVVAYASNDMACVCRGSCCWHRLNLYYKVTAVLTGPPAQHADKHTGMHLCCILDGMAADHVGAPTRSPWGLLQQQWLQYCGAHQPGTFLHV